MHRKKDIDKEGLNEVIHLSKNLLRLFYVMTIVGIVLGLLIAFQKLDIFKFLGGILKVISPLFIGFVIAWLFYPLQKKLVDKGMNKIVSAILIFLVFVSMTVLVLYLLIPVLYKQVNDLITNIPSILASVTDFASKTLDKFNIEGVDIESIKQSLIRAFQDFVIGFTSKLPNNIVNFVKIIVSAVGTIIISLVVGIYMLIDFDNLVIGCRKFLPKTDRKEYINLINNIGANAHKVVNGTFLVALMVFICDTVGFSVIGLNNALLFGLFCGITDLIPYIGPYIGGAAAVIVGFTQNPIIGVGVLIIAIIVQLLESYILQPMVMSKAMELHPVTIIIGLLVFAYLFGVGGMIIATPCMAIIKEISLFIISRHKRKKLFNFIKDDKGNVE